MYHSTALLLPDGRVLSAGSGRRSGTEDKKVVEFYHPYYLYDASGEPRPRPAVEAASSSVGYDEEVVVTLSADSEIPASDIARMTMLRLASTTHGDDQGQRFFELCDVSVDGDDVRATSPTHSRCASPGHYMLFVLSSEGVPSEARYIKLE